MKKNNITTGSIDDVPLNGFHQLMTIRSGGGWVLDGYILSIIGVALGYITIELELNSFWEGMVAASALIGIFIGGFLGGWLSGIVGRRRLYFVGPIIFILCSVGQFWANSGLEIFIYRLLIGVGVGFEYPVAGALLVEFLPKKYRGSRLAALTILWFAGAALAYIIGNLILSSGTTSAWRYVLLSPALIGLFLLIVRIGTPESPRWLISKGRNTEAQEIIKKVYGDSFSLENMPLQNEEEKLSLSAILKSGYGARMLFVSLFWTCSVIPVFAVYAFAPKVLESLNITGDWAAYGSVAITILFVVGCIVATKLIDIMGRRLMVIHSFLWSGIALLLLGYFSDAGGLLILILFGSYALFIGGAQVLQLVYPNEIFPTEIRSFAVGIGASLSRVGAAIGTWFVPISLQNIGIGPTMYIAAGITFIGLIASVLLAPETKSMSLEQAASLQR